MPQRFSATVIHVGINPCVDLPRRVSVALGRSGYIPVREKLNGCLFRTGLVSLGAGRHRLFLNGAMRNAAHVDVGDDVRIALEYDPRPRRLAVPRPLTQALRHTSAASRAWARLTQSRRKEILAYLNSLKRSESLSRNVRRTIDYLLDK
jgi:hypothetical protein